MYTPNTTNDMSIWNTLMSLLGVQTEKEGKPEEPQKAEK